MKLKNCISGFICLLLIAGCTEKPDQHSNSAPLLDNLGDYRIGMTAGYEMARKYVNQGIILANAFNHLEAERSFRAAVNIDSTCAMAYWGIAYVLGPNYNTGNTLGEIRQIREAIDKAVLYGKHASDWEEALINATLVKYPRNADSVNMYGYQAAMKEVYNRFSQNDFIVTLYAESIMNLHAWDFYSRKGGDARPWTSEITGLLEHALQLNPGNPLANHLYIHAVEAAPDVEKALICAERLKTLVPGAGHLVHMPSHVFINTGDYHEGSLANEQAVVADSIYIAECKAQGVYPQLYYPHNYHFLSATAALEGRGAKSIEAAFKMADIIDSHYLRQPGFETTQHYITVPYNVLVKFSQWEKILALPKPDDDLDYPLAVWHFARGMALANLGKIAQARKELEIVHNYAEDPRLQEQMIWEINSMADIVNVADHVLTGEIAMITGDLENCINHFLEAITIEDNLNYNEPPDWFFSVRHLLGDAYIAAGNFAAAEQVYREDLTYWVNNGFALNGLYHSLLLQGKNGEADSVKEKFESSWEYADVTLKYSRVDPEKRTDLVIDTHDGTASDLVYIVSAVCGLK